MNEKVEKREKILMAAKIEFAEKGFSGARMGAISRRAGVNQALLHYYFESKEKLYMELLHLLFGIHKTSYVQETLKNWPLTPPEALYVAIYLLINVHFVASDPYFNRIIAREITEGRAALKSIINEYFIPKINSLEKIIIDGKEQGYFETNNTLLTVLQMIFFVLSFQTNRETYSETELYDKLYGKNMNRDLLDFLIDHTFRALTPIGQKIHIPVIKPEILSAIDRAVENIKNEFELNEDVINGRQL